MFRLVLIVTIAMAYVVAGSDPRDAYAETVKNIQEIDADGHYRYAYETTNGIAGQEAGLGGEQATGGYSYYSPEGQVIQLSYVANDNGFQPQGEHLPTPPPIPYEILKSLEYIRTHAPSDENAYVQRRIQAPAPAPKRANSVFRG